MMLNENESQIFEAVALAAVWAVVGLVASFFFFPLRDVLYFLAIALAPFYVPAILAIGFLLYERLTEPKWRKKGRAARKLRSREKQ
jgi:hypothetical protein